MAMTDIGDTAETTPGSDPRVELRRQRLRSRMRMSVLAFFLFAVLAAVYGRFHPAEAQYAWILAVAFFAVLALAQVWVFFVTRASLKDLYSAESDQ